MWALFACRPMASLEHRGAILADWSATGYDGADPALDELVDQGFDTVVVLVTWYVDSPADVPHAVPGLTPEDASVQRVVRAAQERGLRVGLKVHVDPSDGSWRGDLVPSDADAWMERYAALLGDAIGLGVAEGVDQVVVGTELERLVDHPGWPSIVADTRAVFDGELTYAANWDGYDRVPFWDDLDAIGVDAYFPIEDWPSARRRLGRFADGRPVWLTELGFQSRRGACRTPWWAEGRDDGRVQADCYTQAFDELERADAVTGVFLWHASPRTDDLDAFGWEGKPAEGVVRRWLAPALE
jgi:hypothetical protein